MTSKRVRDVAWLAGLLEGEGCFSTHSAPRKAGGKYWYPEIQVTSTDYDVLVRIVDIVGSGRIYGPHKTRSVKHTPTYSYRVVGHVAREVMLTILPYMCKRRRNKIIEVIEEVDSQ